MRLSPIREENHRLATPRNASNRATAASAPAIAITMAWFRGRMPRSMMARSSSGLTTVISASSAVVTMNAMSAPR